NKLTVPEKGNGEHNRTIFYLFLRSTLTGADHFCSPAFILQKRSVWNGTKFRNWFDYRFGNQFCGEFSEQE
ncbi:hypothetical protein, partial [Agathobaculum desmolans]|uniref:hypothetical protein n=1 Tax=Agathobaculum desmolans TaxID=39484 RepID=UPI000555530C